MKRGIIVVHSGHDSSGEQRKALEGSVDEVIQIAPMTSEDWHYQLEDAVKDLGDGDQIHVQALHYLGGGLAAIARTVADFAHRGIDIVAGGESCEENGIAAGATALTAADNAAARARVAHLAEIARSRRNATPPKCIFVPEDLLEDSE